MTLRHLFAALVVAVGTVGSVFGATTPETVLADTVVAR
jgi:hypothetical protein